MVELPESNRLPIAPLARVFNNVTNSYKFYWFLAILDTVKARRGRTIAIDHLLANMIANAWYPLHYFHLSLGKQDQLGQVADLLRAQSSFLDVNARPQEIAEAVNDTLTGAGPLTREIRDLGNYVPQRFLRTFFLAQTRGIDDWKVNDLVETLAEQYFDDSQSPCLYRFVSTPARSIEIHPVWYEYLQEHIRILEGFCLWHLVNYLQKRNPNVPNIAGKLFRPEQRDLKQAREYWKLVFESVGQVQCIYSHQPVSPDNYSLDHFLPWSFVAHDLLWNIIPTPRAVNSSKGDFLPDIERYFEPFARLQYESVQIVASSRHTRLLEDHLLLLKRVSIQQLQETTFEYFRQVLYDTIVPQAQIARNMGFQGDWRYLTE
ncbi:MAG: hypothetical protein KatS3mg051_1253 [Anaerolineae bacterium]|nr:MAG: hypothetical protein KatS3mg051_1253 [Anaerolineae bacterium]